MKIKLGDFTEVKSGYSLKSSLTNYEKGDINVIQAQDLKVPDFTDLLKITIPNSEKHALIPGDILLSARGEFVARVFREKRLKAIASSSLFIVRVKSPKVMPEYLVHYLNSRTGQSQLERASTSTYIKSISKTNLDELEIPIIPLKEQELVVRLANNLQSQHEKYVKKTKMIDAIFDASISKLITKELK